MKLNLSLKIVLGMVAAAFMAACAAALTPTPNAPVGEKAGLLLTPCQLAAPGLADRTSAECGTFTVYEDRTAQTGRQIHLRVAIIKTLSRNPAPDPFFFLTGGPGQAATESYLQLASAFSRINQDRDIVLVDQRGTGGSNPLLCRAPETTEVEADLHQWLNDCLQTLEATADPRFYTTALAVDDLNDVRAALGYDQINLYGVSYGTRAALTYLRQYPQTVRTVILDGIVPSDEALGLDVARDAQRAFDLFFSRCQAEPDCRGTFPDLQAEFAAIDQTLAEAPVAVALAHPVTGEPTTFTLSHESFVQSLRLLTYAPETVALLPLLIHTTFTTGDYKLFAAQALLVGESLEASISEGMGYSVLCAEDVPFFTEAEAAQANQDTYLGDLQTEQLRQVCEVWPRGDVPADFKQAVSAEVPVLLLSGEADPVTPPENGEHVKQTLPNSLHLTIPGQGHNVIGRGCLPQVAADFVERGSLADLDVTCVALIQPMPFFLTFAGPEP
jgi:pimeloyl-ACP methyl ester carboxylesterase